MKIKGLNTIKELVGTCSHCGKDLYCLDGFFNGVFGTDKKEVFCFDCAESDDDDK